MSKLIEELEIKFNNIEPKIEIQIGKINHLYFSEIKELEKKFNANNLAEKYSNEFNYQRQLLLNQIASKIGTEISNVNEIQSKNDEQNKEHRLTIKENKEFQIQMWHYKIELFLHLETIN